MNNFKVGDIVWLKVGSPKMTIEYITKEGKCLCVWFEGTKKLEDSFRPDVLTDKDPNYMPPQESFKTGF